ncbi:MAG: hypothetical protein ACK5N8_02380 [Alphaproteobacteria bacterium]
MEKNEIPLSFEEIKSRDSFVWNFILFIYFILAGVALVFASLLAFTLWSIKKAKSFVNAQWCTVYLRNYDVVTVISRDFYIVKNVKSGKYGLCKNGFFIFQPRYEKISIQPNYVLSFVPVNARAYSVPFERIARDVA